MKAPIPATFLWSGTFLSMVGSSFFQMSLALTVFSTTKSILAASTVFILTYGAPVLLARVIQGISARKSPKHVLLLSQLLSSAIPLAAAVAMSQSLALALMLVFSRGALEFMLKSARTISVVVLAEKGEVERLNVAVSSAQYLGNASGAVLGAAVLDQLTFLGASCVASGLFLAAAVPFALLPSIAPRPSEAAASKQEGLFHVLKHSPALRDAFLYKVLIVGAFQGFHQVARTALPLAVATLSANTMSILHLVSIAGILFATALMMLLVRKETRRISVFWVTAATAIALPLPFFSPNFASAVVMYFVFVVLFEISFLASSNKLVLLVERRHADVVVIGAMATSYLALTIVATIGAYFADQYGPHVVAMAVSLVAIIIAVHLRLLHRANSQKPRE